ncbi:MAG: hypothetical protein QNL35_02025, partial [Emcibacteraceae bacterium]
PGNSALVSLYELSKNDVINSYSACYSIKSHAVRRKRIIPRDHFTTKKYLFFPFFFPTAKTCQNNTY